MPARTKVGISSLPAPHAALPFELPSGYAFLFRDPDWGSERLDLSTNKWRSGVRHEIRRRFEDSRSAWVAFNLPRGQVMTLTRYHQDSSDSRDLRDVAQVADLIGTGTTEAVDLAPIDLCDAVSSFFWRTVNLDMGAIELYSEAGFRGNRTVLFLSDWQQGRLHRLEDWAIEDRLGSVRWTALRHDQYCDLYHHSDGVGGKYPRMAGWPTTAKESWDTSKGALNDMVSAFRWGTLSRRNEVLEPISLGISRSCAQ